MLSRVNSPTETGSIQHSANAAPGSIRLLDELVKILATERAQTPHSKGFFELFLHVFDHVCRAYKHTSQDILNNVQSIAQSTYKLLVNYSSTEKYQDAERSDEYLVGLVNILRIAVHHHLFEVNTVPNAKLHTRDDRHMVYCIA